MEMSDFLHKMLDEQLDIFQAVTKSSRKKRIVLGYCPEICLLKSPQPSLTPKEALADSDAMELLLVFVSRK